MGQKYLAVLTKVFFFLQENVGRLFATIALPTYTPCLPLNLPPPPPNAKFCKSTVFIFSWGEGADYCNVPPVIAGRNWKQCCFREGLGGGGTKSLLRSNAKVANFCVRCDVSC